MQKISFDKFKQLLMSSECYEYAYMQTLTENRFKAWQLVCKYDYVSDDMRTLHCSKWQVCDKLGISSQDIDLILYGLSKLGLAKKISKTIYKL